MPRFRVLLIGAYGQFGSRVARELSRDDIDLVLAGRHIDRARHLASTLETGAAARLEVRALDVESAYIASTIAALAPDVVIHTAGPFQARDYRVAEAAIAVGSHYIDLADARAFVTGIASLDSAARERGVRVVGGASSVPGLSAAVVAAHLPRFARLDSVDSAISPGNRTPRGLATTQAILGYVGRPFPVRGGGRWIRTHGWQSLRRIRHAALGTRWVARCDVPDLEVLPARYPQLQQCEFRAGLELRRMHFGLWLAAVAVRVGLVRDLPRWAPTLLRLSDRWIHAGSDTGLMTMDLAGIGHNGRPLRLRWSIVARDGSGPQIPATAAVLLARAWRAGRPRPSAGPCLDLFTLDDFMAALAHYPIDASTETLSG
ncbi:saccharopine dehydrogenase family protein [Lysobacter claricitrinus]|uniref:saccharopine dehydrogenase family protein n=1 Tax=Lysobacter claricitrinus TaxID=3367728 RepID=UPI0037DA9ABD